MAKLIQICASKNDLFGLDTEGTVYHYNFNTESWQRLADAQREEGASRLGESRTGTAHPEGPDVRRTSVERRPPSS